MKGLPILEELRQEKPQTASDAGLKGLPILEELRPSSFFVQGNIVIEGSSDLGRVTTPQPFVSRYEQKIEGSSDLGRVTTSNPLIKDSSNELKGLPILEELRLLSLS